MEEARRQTLRRSPLALALMAAGTAVLVGADRVRGEEAAVASTLADAVTRGGSAVDRVQATFFFALDTPLAAGLRVTPECSIAYIVGPVLVALGLLMLLTRLHVKAVLCAALISLSFLAVTNAARMAFVAWAVYRFGRTTGYWWSHLVIGSAFSVVTIAASLALAIRISFAGSGVALPFNPLAGHGSRR